MHWSPAETSNFERAYDNARARHPDRDWPVLVWFDLLHEVVQAEPLVVRGAFSFSLKPIARSLHALGHIQTNWGDGLADGAGAMAGAWSAEVEAKRKGVALNATEIIFAIYESSRRRGRVDLPLTISDNPLVAMVEAGQMLAGSSSSPII